MKVYKTQLGASELVRVFGCERDAVTALSHFAWRRHPGGFMYAFDNGSQYAIV